MGNRTGRGAGVVGLAKLDWQEAGASGDADHVREAESASADGLVQIDVMDASG